MIKNLKKHIKKKLKIPVYYLLFYSGLFHVGIKFLKKINDPESLPNYTRAFQKNSAWYRSIFKRKPAGWSKRTRQRLARILENNNAYIQKLNDMYTNPSGDETYLPITGSKCVDDTMSAETPEENDQVN